MSSAIVSSPANETLAAPGRAKSGVTRFTTVGLIGPPNVGKTTLFNLLTGMRHEGQ